MAMMEMGLRVHLYAAVKAIKLAKSCTTDSTVTSYCPKKGRNETQRLGTAPQRCIACSMTGNIAWKTPKGVVSYRQALLRSGAQLRKLALVVRMVS